MRGGTYLLSALNRGCRSVQEDGCKGRLALYAALHGCRYVASDASNNSTPQLNVQLRELYKRVHPDLFHDIPLAMKANEHSFKLLQVCFVTVQSLYPFQTRQPRIAMPSTH